MKRLNALMLVVAAAVLVAPAPAGAIPAITVADTVRTTTTIGDANRLATVKARSFEAVGSRQKQLTKLKDRVNASKYVTDEHKTLLLSEITSAQTGLSALDTKIQDDTDLSTAVADAKRIVDDYRVYLLLVPKVHELLALDAVAALNTQFQTASPKMANALSAQAAQGANVGAAKEALADLDTKIAAVAGSTESLTAQVAALEPSGYPASQSTIKSTRQALTNLTTQVKAMSTDVASVKRTLTENT